MNTFYIISIVNFFDPMTHILCETDGIDVTVYADFDQAINACIESDECSSVVSDQCAEPQKYELCNGVKYERTGGTYDCNKAARKKCECLYKHLHLDP